jgi:hypothetical protein
MKRNLIIFLILIISAVKHDVVLLSYFGAKIELDNKVSTAEIISTDLRSDNQAIKNPVSNVKVPNFKNVLIEPFVEYESLIVKAQKYVEVLYDFKFNVIPLTVVTVFDQSIQDRYVDLEKHITCCNFRL